MKFKRFQQHRQQVFYTPELDRTINEVLAHLKLQPETSVKDFITNTLGVKHRYYTLCRSDSGEQVFFIALLNYDERSKQAFEREHRLAQAQLRGAYTPQFLPHYRETNYTMPLYWLTTDYIKDEPLEDPENFEKLSHQLSTSQQVSLAETLYRLNNDTSRTKKGFTIDQFPMNSYSQMTSLLDTYIQKGIMTKSYARKAHDFISVCMPVVLSENSHFTHGDFHLGNILLTQDNTMPRVTVLDWEMYHLNNSAYDTAFFFSRLFPESQFRKHFVSSMLSLYPPAQRDMFTQMFRFDCLYNALRWGVSSDPLELDEEEAHIRQTWFIHISEAAVEGFEQLITI